MAFWIEFRCDWREAWSPPRIGDRCWSHDNAGPGEIANNTAAAVSGTRAFIVNHFKKDGFLKIGQNWACPVCAKKIEAGELPRDPDEA